jgi:hypothetical protein
MNRSYTIDDVTLTARRYRTAVRRVRGFKRGELDIDGKTILASKRTPPGRSLRKKEQKA